MHSGTCVGLLTQLALLHFVDFPEDPLKFSVLSNDNIIYIVVHGPPFLTWFNFNPIMDK